MSKRFTETVAKSDGVNWKIPNASLMSFAQKIYGKCPNCGQATIIKANYKYFNCIENSRVQCLNCAFYEDWNSEKIYGAAVGKAKKPCPNCGTKWLAAEVKIKNAKPVKDYAEVTCEVCKKPSYLSLSWHREFNENKPLDPYFNYPLWLQTECVGEILWVFNEEHLNYLKSYVKADLREDDGRLDWSMISRLPKWITSAKNRQQVLKAIAKLEKQITELNKK
ncbi:MAG: hypothetical protein LH614_14970 [Pyrinomonadaceae bacterium]|nr:hypothetical protein [Pyrinomonadaceae bacterium]